MDGVYILDENFENALYMDVFESLIWTVRYQEVGEFELYTPFTQGLLDLIKVGRYVYTNEFFDEESNTAYLMIIESIELDDQHLKITGGDLKTLLKRRIVWGQTVVDEKKTVSGQEVDNTVQDAIEKLVTEAFIDPVEPADWENPFTHETEDNSQQRANRVIPNFQFDRVGTDDDWGKIEEKIQYEGNLVLDAINDLCKKFNVGYEIVYNFDDPSDNPDGRKFHMHLIQPVDHSWDQTDAPAVIFSPEFDNLKKSNYIESLDKYKNVAYVVGESYTDDEIEKYRKKVIQGDAEGLDRRELYVDANDLHRTLDDGTVYNFDQYADMLRERGETELGKEENSFTKVYDGEADTEAMTDYQFGVDYKIGDTVELITRYGESAEVRVTEMVLSASTSGITLIPTFKATRYEKEEANE